MIRSTLKVPCFQNLVILKLWKSNLSHFVWYLRQNIFSCPGIPIRSDVDSDECDIGVVLFHGIFSFIAFSSAAEAHGMLTPSGKKRPTRGLAAKQLKEDTYPEGCRGFFLSAYTYVDLALEHLEGRIFLSILESSSSVCCFLMIAYSNQL